MKPKGLVRSVRLSMGKGRMTSDTIMIPLLSVKHYAVDNDATYGIIYIMCATI